MCGATMFVVSVVFYCGTRKFCREHRQHWMKPVLVLWHCLCDRTGQNQVNQGYNLPPEQWQQEQQPGYSQSIEMTAPTRPQRRLQAITYQPQTNNDEGSGYSGLTVR